MNYEDKKRIAERYYVNSGESCKDVAQKFGLPRTTLYKFLADNGSIRSYESMRIEKRKQVPKDKVNRILQLGQFGDYSFREIAEDIGVSPEIVALVLRN